MKASKVKVNKVAEVANMMVANPETKVTDVMKKFKVTKVYGYNLMSQARTKYLNRREAMLKEALSKPKHRMQSSESVNRQVVESYKKLKALGLVGEDTVTGTTPKAMSELAYNLTKGRDGKESWQTVSITTSGQPILAGGPTEEELNADTVNHPAHYRTGGIETIDFIEAKNLNYHLGNVVKYITRADHKGDRLENLKKAQWYLNREIEKSGK